MAEKVTDEAKKVKNAHLRKVMADGGIDADYVELFHDYAPRSKGKEYSPYARFYKDRKSNKRIMEVSILPHCKVMGHKIESGWLLSKGKYYSKANLFSAIVTGDQIKVTCLSDQPHGAKKFDWVSWEPQLFLNGIEQFHTEPTLLTTDPINAGYHDNTIEWDYGICKRRIRIIEGRIRERWVFASNPHGEVRIKHNHTGALKLKRRGESGKYWINDDEELVPASVFNEAEYPLEIRASPETFHPDPHDENTSVDGRVARQRTAGVAWADIRDGAGTTFDDDDITDEYAEIDSDVDNNMWDWIDRSLFLFDVAGLPDGCTAVAPTTMSLRGTAKDDGLSCTPELNVYSSAPVSNVILENADYGSLGTTAYCDTAITYAAFDTAGWNDWAFNATGIAAVQAASDGNTVVKLGVRESKYDAIDDPYNIPTWGNNVGSSFNGWFAERGNATNEDPKLVVTYTVAVDHEKALSDSVAVAEAIGKAIGMAQSETVAVAESSGLEAEFFRSISDSVAVAEVVVKAPSLFKADTVAITESIVVARGLAKALADSITIAESITSKAIGVFKADTVAVAETFSRVVEFYKSLADTVAISEAIVKAYSLVKAEVIAITDSIHKVRGIAKALSDTIAVAESISKAIGVFKSETVAVAESITSKAIRMFRADTVAITDSAVKAFGMFRAETIAIAEVITLIFKTISLTLKDRLFAFTLKARAFSFTLKRR